MRRRYTIARNPIEALRDRWGLGEGEEGGAPAPPVVTSSAQRLTRAVPGALAPQARAPSLNPLPLLRDRPFYRAPVPSDAGAVDWEARQRPQLEDLPHGDPTEPIVVYPAWESRMVDMRDFMAVLEFTVPEGSLATPAQVLLSTWTVPRGYVAFWKEFRFFMEPVPGFLTQGNTLLSLLIDGQAVPDYFLLPLGPSMGYWQKTFVIGEEGRAFGLQIDFTAAGAINENTRMLGVLYGNVRRRTGAAPKQEVGTPPPPAPEPPPPPRQVAPAPAVARPRLQVFNPVSGAGGRSQTPKLGALDARGQLRAITRAEYSAHRDVIDREFQAFKRVRPSAQLWVE